MEEKGNTSHTTNGSRKTWKKKSFFRLTISRKLIIGYGLLVLAIITNGYLINSTLKQNRDIAERITKIYNSSLILLEEMKILITESKGLISNWVFVTSSSDSPEKQKLREIKSKKYPLLKEEIIKTYTQWEPEKQVMMDTLLLRVDSLMIEQEKIMSTLSSFESYSDPMNIFMVNPKVEEGGIINELSNRIIRDLDMIIMYFDTKVTNGSDEMASSFTRFSNFIIINAIVLIFVSVLIAILTIRNIKRPIVKLKNILLLMGRGNLPEKKIKTSSDEIGEMSHALNILIDGLRKTATFASQIGSGNLNKEFTPLSEEDDLGNALLEMRESLKNARDEEQRRKVEDEKRNWATQGLAKFAEILRHNNDNIEKLSYDIIQNLVEYLNINQGAIFLINDDDDDEKERFLEFKAGYAYERKKYLEKKIHKGEGLVGACYQERETIYLTDVPSNYINIRSGLGGKNPTAILIVPLKINEEVHGIIELASFKEFEKYQIEFVEKIGESIASTISSVKINMKTASLLEQSQQQAEEMRAQEEEMRQNMEELHATQEEMERKEVEMKNQFEALNQSNQILEFDLNGIVKKANDKFYELMSYTEYDIVGKDIEIIVKDPDQRRKVLNDLSLGIPVSMDISTKSKYGELLHLVINMSPKKNVEGHITEALCIITNITKHRNALNDANKKLNNS